MSKRQGDVADHKDDGEIPKASFHQESDHQFGVGTGQGEPIGLVSSPTVSGGPVEEGKHLHIYRDWHLLGWAPVEKAEAIKNQGDGVGVPVTTTVVHHSVEECQFCDQEEDKFGDWCDD